MSAVKDYPDKYIFEAAIPFKAIRYKFPNARILCLTSPQASAIIETCPHINEAIVFDQKAKGLKDIWKKSRELRRHHFDKVVDLLRQALKAFRRGGQKGAVEVGGDSHRGGPRVAIG